MRNGTKRARPPSSALSANGALTANRTLCNVRGMENVAPLRAYRGRTKLTLEQLGAILSVDKSTVMRWELRRVPAERVLEVERVTGVSRHELRPDLYPAPTAGAAA
jgi:DNA-binding transcriptional regulator YiaG